MRRLAAAAVLAAGCFPDTTLHGPDAAAADAVVQDAPIEDVPDTGPSPAFDVQRVDVPPADVPVTSDVFDAPPAVDVPMARTDVPVLPDRVFEDAAPDVPLPDAGPPPLAGYHLVWCDEFDGLALDRTKWDPQTGARHNATNTPDAIAVGSGVLTITTFTEGGMTYTGFLDTHAHYLVTHAYVEARVRFHETAGEWSAFWMQSPTNGIPLGNPALAGVEIDIAEHRFVDMLGANVRDRYESNLHWNGYGAAEQSASSGLVPTPATWPVQDVWHVYAVEWTPTGYRFFFDGALAWGASTGISQRSEYLLLTSEVQTASWAGTPPLLGYGTRTTSTTRTQVDWVRVWQR